MKKTTQLGINPSTASHRLIKDILFNFIIELNKNKCYRCGEEMSRDTFSVEHKIPWMDTENPVELFFDLTNISFSHRSCNSKAARRMEKTVGCGTMTRYQGGCRCEECTDAAAKYRKSKYTKEDRHSKYLRTGT